jgi:F0F1-type ATP synthase membrane subunit c/vacuolar-type H+-ATPase subunit K
MIETLGLLCGLGFSFLVYFKSIKKTDYSRPKKAFYFLFTLTGITGTLFLFGVLIADKLRNMKAH